MRLKLEAISPAEGIAFVRVGQKLRLVRPPYLSENTPVLPEESIQDAIIRHGFSACAEEFEGWADVIAYLNQQVAATRRSLGLDVPDSIRGRDILDVAPPEIVERFLDRVEKELIPNGLFDHAEDFLLALLESSAAHNSEIQSRAVRLLQRNKNARNQLESRRCEFAKKDVRFASLEKRGDLDRSLRLAANIRERGCVFA